MDIDQDKAFLNRYKVIKLKWNGKLVLGNTRKHSTLPFTLLMRFQVDCLNILKAKLASSELQKK